MRKGFVRVSARLMLAGTLIGAAMMAGDHYAGLPKAQGGHFPATVSSQHEAAVGLLVGRRPLQPLQLLQELLSGRPHVNPHFIHSEQERMTLAGDSDSQQLKDSVTAAAAAASSLLGDDAPVIITHANDKTLIGQQVASIDGERASIAIWGRHMNSLLERVVEEGLEAASGWNVTLTTEDGRQIRVPARAAKVAVAATTPQSLAEAGESGTIITYDYFYRVLPDLILQPAPPDSRQALIPENSDGSSAGLAYALSYLNAATDGELFGTRRIAASGQILTTGQVKAVGGFPAKGEAAVASGADILFVARNSHPNPAGERRLQVVEVFQLADAVHTLCQDLGAAGGVTERLCENADDAVTAAEASLPHTRAAG